MQLSLSEADFLKGALPFWKALTAAQQKELESAAIVKQFQKGMSMHRGSEDCAGLFLVQNGQVRVYMISESGKEITLYRLFERDICIFSASCMMKNIQFDLYVDAEKDTSVLLIPTKVYEQLLNQSLAVSDYTNQLMSARFSDVMWVVEQIVFMSFDRRLALFLEEQIGIEGNNTLSITHEVIARHLGSAREVVTRMLKYFQQEGIVKLTRGGISILDEKKLHMLTETA